MTPGFKKTSLLTLTAALFVLMTAMTACGKDPEDSAAAAKKSVGTDGQGTAEEGAAAKAAAHRKTAGARRTPAQRKADAEGSEAADKAAQPAGGTTTEKTPAPTADAPAGTVPNPTDQSQAPTAQTQPVAGVQPGPKPSEPATPVRPDPSRPALADPRLLLTMVDVSKIAPAKARFKRATLAGLPRTEDSDSIMYTPEKGDGFGFALQLFRTKNAQETRKRYETLQASYPNSQEISPVSGKTFFSYWDEVMHIAFVHPAKNLVVVVSCGRDFCDSNKLMEMAGTVSDRLK